MHVSPREVVLGTDEYSILDVTGALKRILRQTIELVPQKQLWLKAAGERLTKKIRCNLHCVDVELVFEDPEAVFTL